jgi:Tol biopolymer transport system component
VRDGLTRTGIAVKGLEYPFSRFERFRWAPSGRFLYFEGISEGARSIWRVAVNARTLEWIDGPERITTGVGDHAEIALSADGARIAFTAETIRKRIWSYPFDRETGRPTGVGQPVTSGRGAEVFVSATPDGRRIVYRSVQGRRNEYRERSLPDGLDRPLITGIDRNSLRLSPDGTRVAYTRFGSPGPNYLTNTELVTLPITGGVERTLLASSRVRFAPSDWSRDGEWILGACTDVTTRHAAVCIVPTTPASQPDRGVRIVASSPTHSLHSPTFSPDGRWIAFTERVPSPTNRASIHVVSTAGGAWTSLTDGQSFNDEARWTTDGSTVYFLSNRTGFLNVWGRKFDEATGRPVGDAFVITSFTGQQLQIPDDGNVDIAVTNRHLLLPVAETSGNVWILQGVNH